MATEKDFGDQCARAALAVGSARYHEHQARLALDLQVGALGSIFVLRSHLAAGRAAWVEALAYLLGSGPIPSGRMDY